MNHAVITGGTGTLGRAIACAMATQDWKIHAPSSADLDVCSLNSIATFFEKNPPDLLVCAAGIILDGAIHRTTEEAWDKVMTVNFNGAAMCARAALPRMIERKGGHIIFISSYSAVHPPAGQLAYATAKASLHGLTGELALCYGASNIRVNLILPGYIESRLTRSVTEKRRKEILQSHALTRLNTADVLGKFIRYLHFELPHTSGQTFQLDSRPA